MDKVSDQFNSDTDKHRKKSIHQPRKKPASRNGYSELSERLFGKIKSLKPLNCKNSKCGSKNLRYTEGTGNHAMKATCKDCGHWYWVDKDIAKAIKHLIEPEPEPKKVICRECQQSAEIIDERYYQCWNCAGKILRINPNSS